MERIRELLEKLGQLSTEELEELHNLVGAEADKLSDEATTPELVSILNELADAGEKVDQEKTTRAEQAAKDEADIKAARDRIAATRGEGDEEEAPEAEAEKDDEEEAPEEGAEAEAESEAEPVVAAGASKGRVRRMAARSAGTGRSPESEADTANRAVVIASGALRSWDPTKPIETKTDLAQAMSDTLKRMDRRSAARGDVLLASATWDYPEDRILTDDQAHNEQVLEAVLSPEAITASGGVCAPVNVDYAVPTWSTAERPLKSGLAAFQVSRGGLRYITPPDFTELEGATGIWSEATDAAPGVETKPVIHVTCGEEQVVFVDAVPTRLGFGNMQGQFSPEYVAANTDLAIVAAARIAENNLLKHIEAACLKNIKQKKVISATRDMVTNLHQAVQAYRWLHRIAPTVPLTAILPEWFKSVIKIDIARETAHQQGTDWNSLDISDAQVESLITACGVNPIWHLDGQAEPASKAYPLQGFASFAEAGEFWEKIFPAKVAWYLFVEGTIQFLDGGRLDLGVVRDSTLDATNDYETFVETFEGIAFRGFTHGALQFVSEWVALGQSAAAEVKVTAAA
jgi:hypothetical protein